MAIEKDQVNLTLTQLVETDDDLILMEERFTKLIEQSGRAEEYERLKEEHHFEIMPLVENPDLTETEIFERLGGDSFLVLMYLEKRAELDYFQFKTALLRAQNDILDNKNYEDLETLLAMMRIAVKSAKWRDEYAENLFASES